MIGYKLVALAEARNWDVFKSLFAPKEYAVTYRVGEISKPHPDLATLGCGLFIFDSISSARRFSNPTDFMLKVEYETTIPIVMLQDVSSSSTCPHGTICVPELKVLEVVQ